MKDLINKITRPCRRPADFFLLAALISFLMVVVGEIISESLFGLLAIDDRLIAWSGSDNIGTFLGMYLSTLGAWIAFLLFVLLFKRNRPMLKTLKSNRSLNNLKGI